MKKEIILKHKQDYLDGKITKKELAALANCSITYVNQLCTGYDNTPNYIRFIKKYPDKVKGYKKKYRDAHKDEAKEYRKAYRAANKEMLREQARKYREEHKEELREYRKRKWQEAKREKNKL